jgi:hypothetical protein
MSTRSVDSPPVIHFCPQNYCCGLFYVDYQGKQWLSTCQKVAIVLASIFGLIFGGLALSYHWRKEMGKELYDKHLKALPTPTPLSLSPDEVKKILFAKDAPLFIKMDRIPPTATLISMTPTERAARQRIEYHYRNSRSSTQ